MVKIDHNKSSFVPEGTLNGEFFITPARSYFPGMGKAVADRTINRKEVRNFDPPLTVPFSMVAKNVADAGSVDAAVAAWAKDIGYQFAHYEVYEWNGEILSGHICAASQTTVEDWADVADRVAMGSALLHPEPGSQRVYDEYVAMRHHLRQGSVLMSGRHLQHGDVTQPHRNMEVFTNCSTAPTSFLLTKLLLNGSGVGRAYDDALMLVDYSANMPIVVPVIDWSHGDVISGEICGFMTPTQARHMFAHTDHEVIEVEDSREGWAKVVEKIEVETFKGTSRNKILIIDFTKVRKRGEPIRGMQNRPAAGPGDIMKAIRNVAAIRDSGMEPWRATMFVDHFMAECVVVGGARRAARMATKSWKDKSVLGFIHIKRPLEFIGQTSDQIKEIRDSGAAPLSHLWTSNNSVTTDAEFWFRVRKMQRMVTEFGEQDVMSYVGIDEMDWHAWQVFNEICFCSYWDATGEPGIINQDKLTENNENIQRYLEGNFVGSLKYQIPEDTNELLKAIAEVALSLPYLMITNPCLPYHAPVLGRNGITKFGALKEGDEIWSKDGWVTVTKKWSNGTKPVYRYRTTAGTVYCTEDHRIVSQGEKVEAKDAESIDRLWGPAFSFGDWDAQTVMDGLMIGDGSRHLQSRNKVYLDIGAKDYDYFRSDVSGLIVGDHPVKIGRAFTVITTVTSDELPALPERVIPERFAYADRPVIAAFLRGLFSANGSVNGSRITLKTTSPRLVEQVQVMLSALGIPSYFTTNKPKVSSWHNGDYESRESYDININTFGAVRFASCIGFIQGYKTEKLQEMIARKTISPRHQDLEDRQKRAFDLIESEYIGDEEVFDITVSGASHTFWAGGCDVSNCGEICLVIFGGYCVIADVVPFHAGHVIESYQLDKREWTDAWDDDAEDAFRTATRALIRTNLMDCVYNVETKRTNRIGVGMTGIHEYAFARFGYGWKELVQERVSLPFWQTLSRFKRAVVAEAKEYSALVGLPTPHTNTTFKPAGTTSKLFGLTEGAHLPSMRELLRWVQFRNDDPLIKVYRDKGYPVRELKSYAGTTIVGFPTQPVICQLGMGDKLVTAAEATPEEQYEFLRLIEKYWITGVAEDSVTPLKESGNQVSYTLKYDPNKVSYDQFVQTLLDGQSSIRCCSVMPQIDGTSYEYQPETPISKDEYERIVANITDKAEEDIGREHVECAGGSCPIDFNQNSAAA